MQLQVNIGFDQLVALIKKLPAAQQDILKSEIENISKELSPNLDLETFLLQAPTFSKKQLGTIDKTRNAINQWRGK